MGRHGKTAGEFRDDLRALRIEFKQCDRRRAKAEAELNHYRRFVRDKFEWYVELSGKNKYPHMVQLIVSHVQFFNRREPFDWNMLPKAF